MGELILLAGIYIPHRFFTPLIRRRIYHNFVLGVFTISIHCPNYCTVHVYVVIHCPHYCTVHVYVVIHCPHYCTVHVYVVIHFCDIVWSLGGNESVQVFLIVCLYMYCRWRSSYQEGRIGIPVTGLKPPYVSCAYTKPVHWFPTSYVMVFCCVQCVQFNWGVIVRFVGTI